MWGFIHQLPVASNMTGMGSGVSWTVHRCPLRAMYIRHCLLWFVFCYVICRKAVQSLSLPLRSDLVGNGTGVLCEVPHPILQDFYLIVDVTPALVAQREALPA